MDAHIDRRTFLQSALGTGLATVFPTTAAWAAAQRARTSADGAFRQGLASGQPGTDAITLWTRLEGVSADATLRLEISTDPGFGTLVHRGSAIARARNDHTVRVRAHGTYLKPGSEYYYRFATRNESSPVGRFRTTFP